jgi:hypothetical protein
MTIKLTAVATVLAAAAMASAAALSSASAQGPAATASLGQLEVKAYQKIPKAKVAVELTSDSELGRHLRGKVMEQLAKRGNQVGFSGGNVMRMDVLYLDLSGGGGSDNYATMGGQPSYAAPGSNPRQELPANRIERRDRIDPKSAPTLRMSLSLYASDTGKVLWAASSSCSIYSDVQRVGESMVDAIFANADKDHISDAGCPL